MASVKCPKCGAQGDPRSSKGPFEVRGRYRGKAVHKCVECGSGLQLGAFTGVLFGKPTKIPDSTWSRLEDMWYQQFGYPESAEKDAAIQLLAQKTAALTGPAERDAYVCGVLRQVRDRQLRVELHNGTVVLGRVDQIGSAEPPAGVTLGEGTRIVPLINFNITEEVERSVPNSCWTSFGDQRRLGCIPEDVEAIVDHHTGSVVYRASEILASGTRAVPPEAQAEGGAPEMEVQMRPAVGEHDGTTVTHFGLVSPNPSAELEAMEQFCQSLPTDQYAQAGGIDRFEVVHYVAGRTLTMLCVPCIGRSGSAPQIRPPVMREATEEDSWYVGMADEVEFEDAQHVAEQFNAVSRKLFMELAGANPKLRSYLTNTTAECIQCHDPRNGNLLTMWRVRLPNVLAKAGT